MLLVLSSWNAITVYAAQNFDDGKVCRNLTNQACQKVDKQKFDRLS